MTDRVHSLTVVLEKDLRVDDVESVENALRHIRGVVAVGRNISDPALYTGQMRAYSHLRSQILDVLYPKAST